MQRILTAVSGLVLVASLAAQPVGFPTLVDIETAMSDAAANHPAICRFVDLTSTYGTPATYGGNHQYAVKISDNVASNEDEPRFLLVAAHHGNEYGTPIVALDAITRLTENYATDPAIAAIVDEYEIWIAPVWNPDGYPASRRNGAAGGGVDLNRNYPFLWSSACNNGVKGPSPASEPETRTMIALSEDRHFTKVLDFHSSGRETLHGYATGCNLHRLASYLRSEAIALSTASGYGGAVRGPSADGEHYQWQLGNFSNLAFLTEISNTQSPTRASADAEAAQLWPGTLWLLQRPIPVQGHVTDAITGAPLAAEISYVENPFTLGERNRSEPVFGRYHAFLPAGSHTLRVRAAGYITRDVPVTVGTGSTTLDIALATPDIAFSFPNGLPTQVAPAGGTTIRVDVTAQPVNPQAGTGVVRVAAGGESWAYAMTEIAPNMYEAVLPALPCSDGIEFSFSAADQNGTTWSAPIEGSFDAGISSTSTLIANFDGETDAGWTAGQPGDTAQTGAWNRMDPQPTSAQPGDDHTPAPGTDCWVTDGRAGTSVGTYDIDRGFTTLLSPRLDLSATPGAMISYWRWYVNNGNSTVDDVFRIDISNDDGQNWSNVETLGPTGPDTQGGWIQFAFRVADEITPSDRMRLRFIAEDIGGGSIVEAAIDDVAVTLRSCDGSVDRAGIGCADSSGQPLRIEYAGGVGLGQTLKLGLSSGAALPFSLLGGAGRFDPEIVIPGTGTPGCNLYVVPDFSIGPFAAGTQVGVTIPVVAALVGRSLSWQAAVADFALAVPIKAATSDYLVTVFGP